MRNIKYTEAIREATDIVMERDKSVYLMGLGVPDPKGIFGTTLNLQNKYGADRVLDTPLAENGMTGIGLGTALLGFRPIMTHQRVEFVLLAMEQIINQAAKWCYMNAGKMNVPMVIRLIIGRGWGQGPQHSQSLETLFAHIPGLKVVMPATPYDAKGLMIAAVEDNNPVIFIEHRWLHNIFGDVPEGHYSTEIGKARVAKEGKDITIVTHSYMLLEAIRAAEMVEKLGVSAEVIDLRTIRPLDKESILNSVSKTGRLVVADNGWTTYGVSSEIVSIVTENIFDKLKFAPARMGVAEVPIPSTRALAKFCYPKAVDIANKINSMMGLHIELDDIVSDIPIDIPDKSFTGPF